MSPKTAPSKLPPRQNIPKDLEARLLFEADHTCCICQDRHESDVQIHHISGRDRSIYDNLIVLCINCHSRVERGGGLGKGFTPAELRRYKKQWTQEVKQRRKANILLDREFASVVELEVRKLGYAFQSLEVNLANERRALEILSMVHCYSRDFGARVKEECLSTIYDTCNWLRRRVATELIVSYQTSIVTEALPMGFGGLVAPRRKPITAIEMKLLIHAINVAGEICYDMCKYIRDGKIAYEAVVLLADCLRFACLNGLEKIRAEVLNEFEGCTRISGAAFRGEIFKAGLDLLTEWKAWAFDH
jgi:hypothetical protein